MKKIKDLLYLVIVMILFSTSSVFAFAWEKVGGNPFKGNARQAIQAMKGLTADEKKQAIEAFEAGNTNKTTVFRLERLSEMISGNGWRDTNVSCAWIGYNQLAAESFVVNGKEVLHFYACNNYGLRRIKTIQAPPPQAPPVASQPIQVNVAVNNVTSGCQQTVTNIPIAPMAPYGWSTSYAPSTMAISASPYSRPGDVNITSTSSANPTSIANPSVVSNPTSIANPTSISNPTTTATGNGGAGGNGGNAGSSSSATGTGTASAGATAQKK